MTVKDEQKPAQPTKRPYVKPTLERLGTVRELTGAGSGSVTEAYSIPAPMQ